MLAGHHEELPHHPAPLTDILLHELRPGHTDEFAVGMVRHRSRQQRLPRPRRPIKQDTLRLRNAQTLEEFRVFEAEFDHFFDLLDLLVEAADHVVRGVGHFLDHHEGDEGVDGGGEEGGEFVGVGEEGDSFAGGEFGDVYAFCHVDDYNI